MASNRPTLSVVVPLYNEAAGIEAFYGSLVGVLAALKCDYEIILCNDGSTDGTLQVIQKLAKRNKAVRYLSFTRNFGKEAALTAGIHAAHGKAILMLDADGQHPVKRIPEFYAHWEAGAQVVIGVRTANRHQTFLKKLSSAMFYRLFNKFSGTRLIPGSTDYRLIDEKVQQNFNRLNEHNRITRGLIDWMGYAREYIYFEANERIAGEATYSFARLVKLSIDSVISLSVSPLFVVAYVGAVVLPVSVLIGIGMVVNAALGDPLGLHATGGAYVAILTLCLVGILMVSQGVIGLYLSHIHAETQSRPLYLIDHTNSSDK